MRVIGLTGGIACGKSTVAGWLKELGAVVIDADAISHSLTADGGKALPAIFAAFGDGVKNDCGMLSRAKLAERVFSDKSKRTLLNDILHPFIEKQMRKEMEICRKMGCSIVVLDVPLLFEAGMEDMADEVWCVSAPAELQIARLEARSGMPRQQAEARIDSQWPLSQKECRADAVLHTDRPMDEVRAEATRLYEGAVERSRR